MAKASKSTKKTTSKAKASPARRATSAKPAAKRAAPARAKAAASRSKAAGAKAAGKAPTKATSKSAAAKSTTKSRSAKTVNGSKAAVTKSKATSRKRQRIDVKVGSFGGPKPGSFGFNGQASGASFLAGKPGSAGAASSEETKSRLTRTKLNARELRHFRELLLAKRRQLLGDMETMENEALRSETSNLSHLPVHMADMGTDNYEQEFTLSLVDRDRQLVDEIDHALKKIDEKTYGICEGTGQMISKERLDAQPWARYSIEHARLLQRPGIRRP